MLNSSFLIATVLALTAPLVAQAKSLVASGGTCASQGVWTSRALEQSHLILTTAEQLKDDPDCKALVDAISKVDAKTFLESAEKDSAQLDGPGAKYESLPGDLMALRTVLMQNPSNANLNSRLSPILAKSTVDLAANNASLMGPLSQKELDGIRNRMKRTVSVGEGLLSAVFTSMAKETQCLQKSKNTAAGLSLISASIRLMSAFASGSETTGQNLSSLIAQFHGFLHDMKYAKVINELNVTQFWTEMSCLIETTQQSYCGAKDGLQLLEFQAKEAQVLAELRDNLAKGRVSKDSAVEGYILLTREVVNVTRWLQRVQSGVAPRNLNEATFKNNIWTTVDGLTQNINLLQGMYNENLQVFRSLPSVEQKQQNIRTLLRSMTNTITRTTGNINFFTQAVQDDLVPFYLLGRNAIPDEVLGKNNSMPMEPFKYLQDSSRVPELNSPDAAMATILERLSSLSELALREGSKYFAQNLTVDHVNLVDETFTDSSVNVYESLKNVRAYIARLAMKYAKTKGDSQRLTLSMADTVSRIDRVLARFNELSGVAEQYNIKLLDGSIKLGDESGLTRVQQDKIRAIYKDLVTSVYDEFNLLLQKEAFISQRLSTYVRFDLFQRLDTKEDMSPYVQYLLVASGKNVMNRFQEFQAFNAAEFEADLSEAQRINRHNLEQMEELFAGDVWNYLNKLSQETGNPYVKRYTDNPFRPMYSLITDLPNVTWQQLRHLPGYTGQHENQDEDGALAFLRAKVCTQTLGFNSWMHFQELCQGAVLQSRMTAKAPKDLHLQFNYQELVKEKNMGFLEKMRVMLGGVPPTGKRYQHVCALRDFYRNNQVYWLTLDFQGAGGRSSDPNKPAPGGEDGSAPDVFKP